MSCCVAPAALASLALLEAYDMNLLIPTFSPRKGLIQLDGFIIIRFGVLRCLASRPLFNKGS